MTTRGGTGGALLWLFGVCACENLFAANDRTIFQYQHTGWTAKDGAPTMIEDLAQTSDGYLWLGTLEGLFRFDGVHFERYDLQSGKNGSDPIYSLLATPDGGLWIGLQRGGVIFLKDSRITGYGEPDGLPPGSVDGFAVDSEGVIWTATSGGLARLEGSRWRRVAQDWGYPGKSAKAVFVDREGTLWVASENTIVFLPRGKRAFQQTGERLGGRTVFVITQAPDGALWMTEEQIGATTIVVPGRKGPRLAPRFLGCFAVFFDRAGSLWVTTTKLSGAFEGRLYHVRFPEQLYETTMRSSDPVIETFEKSNGLTGRGHNVLEDREGNIWVGTEGGLDRFRQSNVVPTGIHLATLAGGYHGDDWTGISPGPKYDTLIHIPGRPPIEHSFSSYIYAAYREPSGVTWLGNQEDLWRVANGQLRRTPLPAGITKGSRVQAITLAQSGLWVSILQDGVFLLRDGVWVPFGSVPSLPRQPAMTLLTDSRGRVWFGYRGSGGIAVLDGSAVSTFGPQEGLQVGTVLAIHEHAGHVWIGGDRGLALFDSNRIRMITAGGGETFRGTSGVVETSAGDLWIYARAGIFHADGNEVGKTIADSGYHMHYEVFDALDGLTELPNTRLPTEIATPDGRLWFNSASELVEVDAVHLLRNKIPPPVFIRSIDSGGKVYTPAANVSLPARTASLRIAYTALSYAVPERVRFRYWLEGVDKDWQDAGTRREAFYTNLGPGQYRFRVVACNNDGVWNEAGAVASLHIDPAYYQTTWFAMTSYATGLALLWLLYRFRLGQATAQVHSRLQGQIAERERIARELHDTLLQSFQALMLHLEVVNQLLPEGRAKTELKESLGHADRAIAEGRSAVYDLRSSAIATNDLPESINALGEELSAGCTATFRLVVEGRPREVRTMIRDELCRIVREALRNAFHHSRARHIEAEITYGGRALVLRIRDDGDGIPTEILEKGRPGHYGLTGMRERSKQVGGKLDLWSGVGTGTEIEVNIAASIAYATPPGHALFHMFRRKRGDA